MSEPPAAPPGAPRRSATLLAPLELGDFVPRLNLPDPSGRPVNLSHQTIAGRLVVLLFPAAGATLDAWAEASEALRALDGRVFVVTPSAAPVPAPLDALVDREGVARPAFGLSADGAAIIDAGGRFAARLAGGAATPDDVAATCRRIHAETPPDAIVAQAPVVVLPRAIAPELCTRLLDYWTANEKRPGSVSQSGSRLAYDAGLKQREDVLIDDEPLMRELMRAMRWRVVPSVRRAFNWEPTQFEAFRVGCYPAQNGYFRRHRDNTTPNTDHRVYALSINLNEDYTGGELVFPEFGRMRYRPPTGGAVIFSCSLLHEALDVTNGRRFGLFSFMFDAAGEAKVAARLAKQCAGAEPG
jgi:2OG-Fe(II) oxygenase superfamily